MGKLNQRLATLEAALATLEEILRHKPSVVVRDATIQRFEYTAEAAWKALKHYLLEVANSYLLSSLDAAPPRRRAVAR